MCRQQHSNDPGVFKVSQNSPSGTNMDLSFKFICFVLFLLVEIELFPGNSAIHLTEVSVWLIILEILHINARV